MLQPSQYLGRSGGSSPYQMKRASRSSWDHRSVLFTVDGCTVIQDPVFFARHIRRAPWTEAPAMVAAGASSARWALRLQTDVHPSWRQAKWSDVQNSTWPLSAATRCPVMNQDAVQFSGAVRIGSGRAGPRCFTGRRATPLSGAPSPNHLKITSKKVSCSAFSTISKLSPMLGVTCCTNVHSYWSDFFSPE